MSDTPRKRPKRKGPGPIFLSQDRLTKKTNADFLRSLFKSNDILGKVLRGELQEVVRDNTPDPIYNLPSGTISRYITYTTPAGRVMAEAHRFILPPPESPTQPDPKKVVDGLITYILEF